MRSRPPGTEIGELVERAGGTGAEARAAAELLGGRGPGALPGVVKALSNPWVAHGELPLALRRIYATASTDTVARGLAGGPLPVFEAAVSVLRDRSTAESTGVLVDTLRGAALTSTRRARVAHACGACGDPSAVPALEGALDDALGRPRGADDPPTLLVESVVALAKLGNFPPGDHLVPLAADPFPPTRALVVRGLRIAVGEGMVEALAAGVLDGSTEVRAPAVEALFLLGLPASLQPLWDGVRGDCPDVRDACRVRLNDVLGTSFSDTEDDLRALRARCAAALSEWDAATRYRSGRPFTVGGLAGLARAGCGRRRELLDELRWATGADLTRSDDLESSLEGLQSRFPVREGALYRWGHLVPSGSLG